ncbi:MAG: hypothetical protein GY779_05700 [Gammaproteobacteria bacterium]|nr:hypothetical protein [Gammaproteobacteria bacterium]
MALKAKTTRKPRKTAIGVAQVAAPVDQVAPTLYPVLLHRNYHPINDFELLALPLNGSDDLIEGEELTRREPNGSERKKVWKDTECFLSKGDAIRVTSLGIGVRNDPFV